MSKIARVKFIRDKEPNIKALTAKNKVLDGALYVAIDTGTLWMGISSSSLIQIKDNINTNTTYNLTKSGNTITLRGSDGSTFNVTDSNTVYGNATTSAAGLMSAADKAKLDGVSTGSNRVAVDAELSTTSTNPVQNKVIKSALDGKSNTGHKHVKADITDFPTSMPASDVPAWAKASSKPSYTISEVSGNLPASRISGVIDAAHLPSYVDDVIEGYLNGGKFYTTKSSSGAYSGEIKAEAGKIYVDLSNNKTYRWSGSTYVVISETIALGTTHATAGYGDESRAAYNHSISTGNPHKTTKADLGLGSVENKSSATIRGELTSANVTTALGYTPPKTDTNTHYTTHIVAGAKSGTANAATTNGNTYINVTDDNTFRSGVVIKGTGATSVTSDASGNITIHSTDTNTVYGNATTSAAGLMSAADKAKLDGVSTGSNRVAVDAELSTTSTNPVQNKVIKSALDGKSNTGHKHVKADITDFPTSMPASDVPAWAKASSKPSYSWSEISDRPSIPSVGNGTVTITQNGATKGTFTLNQSGNATIALTDNNTVYSLPAATSSTLGGVKVGSNITNSSGTISLTKANVTSALGYTPPTSDTNTWRPEEVIISSTQPSASTCKLWIKI